MTRLVGFLILLAAVIEPCRPRPSGIHVIHHRKKPSQLELSDSTDNDNINKLIFNPLNPCFTTPKPAVSCNCPDGSSTTAPNPPGPQFEGIEVKPSKCGHTQFWNTGEERSSSSQQIEERNFPWHVVISIMLNGSSVAILGGSVVSQRLVATSEITCTVITKLLGSNPSTVPIEVRAYFGVTRMGEPLTSNIVDQLFPNDFALPEQFETMKLVRALHFSLVSGSYFEAESGLPTFAPCLLEIDGSVSFDSWKIQPICIPTDQRQTCLDGDDIIITGFGDTSNFAIRRVAGEINATVALSKTMKSAKVKILPKFECQLVRTTQLTIGTVVNIDAIDVNGRNSLISNARCYDASVSGATAFGDVGGAGACFRNGYFSLDYMQDMSSMNMFIVTGSPTVNVRLATNVPLMSGYLPTRDIFEVSPFGSWIQCMSERKRVAFTEVQPKPAPYKCGHTSSWNPSAVQGTGTTLAAAFSGGIVPWHAVVIYMPTIAVMCGGTVIAPDWVLMSNSRCCPIQNSLGNVKVHFGVSSLQADGSNATSEAQRNVIAVATFGPICLMKLESALTFGSSIQPICLPKSCDTCVNCDLSDRVVLSAFVQDSATTYQSNLSIVEVEVPNLYDVFRKIDESSLERRDWLLMYGSVEVLNQLPALFGNEGAPAACYRRGFFSLDFMQITSLISDLFANSPMLSKIIPDMIYFRICSYVPWIRAITGYAFDESTIW